MSIFKIHKGTRPDGEHPLCLTCKKGTVMRGAAESQESIYCGEIGQFLKMRVVQCSDFKDRRDKDLYDMREAAWILSTDRKKKIGFTPAKEWRKSNQHQELTPGEYD